MTYGGQVLWVEARSAEAGVGLSADSWDDRDELAPKIANLERDYTATLDKWRLRLAELDMRNQRIVAWGAGAKGVSFFNMLYIHDQIRYVVDINPRKRGHFMPCTAQEIVCPEDLTEIRPDYVLVMNPMYEVEIRETINQQGLNAELICV